MLLLPCEVLSGNDGEWNHHLVDFREGGLEGISLIEEAGKGLPIKKIVLGRHDSFLEPFSFPSFSNDSHDPNSDFEDEIGKLH